MNNLYWVGLIIFLPVIILILMVMGEFLLSIHELLEIFFGEKVRWFYYAVFFLMILNGC